MIFFRKDSNNSHNPIPLQIFLTMKKKKKVLPSRENSIENYKFLLKKKKIVSAPDGLEKF